MKTISIFLLFAGIACGQTPKFKTKLEEVKWLIQQEEINYRKIPPDILKLNPEGRGFPSGRTIKRDGWEYFQDYFSKTWARKLVLQQPERTICISNPNPYQCCESTLVHGVWVSDRLHARAVGLEELFLRERQRRRGMEND